jgi:hypothetical protein
MKKCLFYSTEEAVSESADAQTRQVVKTLNVYRVATTMIEKQQEQLHSDEKAYAGTWASFVYLSYKKSFLMKVLFILTI